MIILLPQKMGQFPLTKTIVTLVKKVMVITSDASELSSARFSSDSARARGFPARLGSARDSFEPARLVKIGHVRAKIGSVQAMKKNRLGPELQTLSLL